MSWGICPETILNPVPRTYTDRICPGSLCLGDYILTICPDDTQKLYVLTNIVYVLAGICLEEPSWQTVICPGHHGYMSWDVYVLVVCLDHKNYMSWTLYLVHMSWAFLVYVLGTNRLYMSWVYVLTTSTICPEHICPGYMSWALLLYVLGTKCLYMSWWYVLTTKTICPERYILYICPEHFWYMSWVPIVCICPGYMSWPLVPYVLSIYVLGICLEHYCYMSWVPSVCICLGGMSWPQKLYVLNVYILYICLEMYWFMSWEASVRICLGVMSWPLWLYVLSVYILDICPERYGYMSWVVSDRICLGSMSWTVCPESIRPGNMSWVHVLINNKLMYILCFIVYDNQMSTPHLFYCLW